MYQSVLSFLCDFECSKDQLPLKYSLVSKKINIILGVITLDKGTLIVTMIVNSWGEQMEQPIKNL